MKRIAYPGIAIALFLSVTVGAQSQSSSSQSASNQSSSNQSSSNQSAPSAQSSDSGSSLGDYARHVRKDSNPSKPKVYDNDNLPTDDKLSIVGSPQTVDNSSEAKSDQSASTGLPDGKAATDAKASADKSAPPAKLPEDPAAKQAAVKQWTDKISTEKDQIDLNERELNVLQREYQIRAAAMYGDVGNRLRNSGDWDKQDAQYKQEIADKQKILDDARLKLADTQEDARKAGVPESDRGEQ